MLTSLIRTFIPWLVALIGPWLLRNLGITETDLSAVLTVLVGAGYYLVARLLERVDPRFGILLGVPAQPSYALSDRRRDDTGSARPLLLAVALVVLLTVSAFLAGPASAHRRHQPTPPPAAVPQHPEVVRLAMVCDHTVWATVRVEQLVGVQWGPAAAQQVLLQGIGGAPGGWRAVGSGLLVDGGAAVHATGPTPVSVRLVAADGTISAPVGVPELPDVSCG